MPLTLIQSLSGINTFIVVAKLILRFYSEIDSKLMKQVSGLKVAQMDVWLVIDKSTKRHYLETDPDPIAMVIRVELFTHKPSETNANWHCMVTHERQCYRWLLSIGLVDK